MKKSLLALITLGSLCWACTIASNRFPKATGNSVSQNDSGISRKDNPMGAAAKSINTLRIDKVEVSRTAHIALELENSSNEPLKVWKDSNSWGAACWRLLLIRNERLETFFQNPDQGFTKNGPTFNEIAGRGRFEQKLDLNGGNWCGLGHCGLYNEHGFGGRRLTFEANDKVIVIYDVPVTQEARDLGVWYGVIAATATVQ